MEGGRTRKRQRDDRKKRRRKGKGMLGADLERGRNRGKVECHLERGIKEEMDKKKQRRRRWKGLKRWKEEKDKGRERRGEDKVEKGDLMG